VSSPNLKLLIPSSYDILEILNSSPHLYSSNSSIGISVLSCPIFLKYSFPSLPIQAKHPALSAIYPIYSLAVISLSYTDTCFSEFKKEVEP